MANAALQQVPASAGRWQRVFLVRPERVCLVRPVYEQRVSLVRSVYEQRVFLVCPRAEVNHLWNLGW